MLDLKITDKDAIEDKNSYNTESGIGGGAGA